MGIKTDRGEPRARVPNRNYWNYVQGRSGVGATDNYSLFHDIRGETDVQGVPVRIDVGGDFAFFLYPGSANDATTFPAQAARTGDFRVLATMGDGVEFLPTRASGRLAVDTAFGTVAVRFTRDLSEDNDDIRTTAFYRGSYRYWRHAIVGRLVVEGQDLGAVTEVKLGEINHGRALRRRVLDQNFRSVGAMERNDNGELRCHEDGCDIVVRRRLLRTP